ncbi:MAG: phycobilisome rod-core linker polypeptide [Prochlorococcus sp.]|nr:phycobilisome rod-core linker polypeptide [Prochlorococcaceae cyanobacterium Fu_MAG_50]
MSGSQSAALGFGGTSKWDAPVSYNNCLGADKQPARANTWRPVGPALNNGDFLRQSCSNMKIGIGPRMHSDCPHAVTFEHYSPNDRGSLEQAISAGYRQVYGNAHVMDQERSLELEAQLCNGDIDVRGFVRGLAKSSFYKSRFFEAVSPHRGVELNFKHLLGRPPVSHSEVSEQIALLASSGHDAVVDSLVDSAEYQEVFGADTVPYLRAWNSPAGIHTSTFSSMASLEQNFVCSDNSIGGKSQLLNNLARGIVSPIRVPTQVAGGVSSTSVTSDYTKISFEPTRRGSSGGGDTTPMRSDSYVGFGLGQREQEVFLRCPGDSADQLASLIRSCYRQVMGNPHLMEFERCISAESKFLDGYLSTREFVRAIGLSSEYRSRFFETNAPYRFIELNFKHFLGRAPQSQAEVSEHIRLLADQGYEAEICSYIDSSEYQSTFGEDTVPYVRILSENGRSQVAFNRHLCLAEGYAASDTVLTSSALVTSVATETVPSGWSKTTTRINRTGAQSGSPDPTTKRFRIVVAGQPAGARQRTANSSYLVSGKDMSSQMKYIHARGGRILSITEVM